MIVLYQGARGRGKTLTLTKDALKLYQNGWKIYSNIESIPFATFKDVEEIKRFNKNSKMKDCVLIIDEIQTLFDSRRSMANENRDFSYFIQQIRKRGIILLCTTQFSSTMDVRLRQHIDVIAIPRFNKTFEVCEVMYIDRTSIEDGEYGLIDPKTTTIVFNAKQIFGLYDTKEMIV